MDHTKKKLPLLLLTCILLLSACGSKDHVDLPPEPEDGVLIYAALNPVDNKLEQSVEKFNEEHADVQIQVRDYSDEDGPQRLLVELAAGRVPDIIEMQRIAFQDYNDAKNVEAMYFGSPLDADMSDFYWMPYRQMAQKGYLEDLWPYIENDPDLGWEGVLEAPLKAAEVDGGLYMLFKEVSVSTLIGSKALLGDRRGWTLEELTDAFASMPPDSTILRYDATQSRVFTALLSPTLEQYIDWETGQCHFDSEDFRSMMDFLKLFPAEFESNLTREEVEAEAAWNLEEGWQMLEAGRIGTLWDVAQHNALFKGSAVYIGYPTVDGSPGSSFILHGKKLAMSSVCWDKEAAWEFMRQILQPQSWGSMRRSMMSLGNIRMRINRRDFQQAIKVEFSENEQTTREYIDMRMCSNGPFIRVYLAAREDIEPYEAVINNTTQIYWPNTALSEVVWDAIGPYLAGDKDMDETIRLLQNRVTLYVNEQK